MKQFYYFTDIPMMCYSTDGEVDMLDDSDSEDPCPQPKLIWQEAAAKCNECGAMITGNAHFCNPEYGGCGSRNVTPIEPIYFDDWTTADAFASAYWEKKFAELKMTVTED